MPSRVSTKGLEGVEHTGIPEGLAEGNLRGFKGRRGRFEALDVRALVEAEDVHVRVDLNPLVGWDRVEKLVDSILDLDEL